MKVNNILYSYLKDIQQQNNLQKLKNENTILQQIDYNTVAVFVLANTIYNTALNNIRNKTNIISEDKIISNKIFYKEVDKIKNDIITQKYNINNILTNNIIFESFFSSIGKFASNAWNYVKKAASDCLNAIAKIGKVIYDWVKNLIKIQVNGCKLGKQLSKGGKADFSSPEEAINTEKTNTQLFNKTLPFLNSVAVQPNQIQMSKESAKKCNAVKSVLEKGGNADEAKKTVNSEITNITKNIVIEKVLNKKEELSENAKSYGKELNKENNQQKKNNNSDIEKVNTNTNADKTAIQKDKILYELFNNNFNYDNDNSLQNLKNFIIENVYLGFTPKMIFGDLNNKSKQNDIIICNSRLSFKTNNYKLVCEQTDLTTKNTIIYQSNELFKGNHLIYQETQQKFISNNILLQQIKKDNILLEQIKWGDILLIVMFSVMVILAIMALIQLIQLAIDAIVAGFTVGIGAAVSRIIGTTVTAASTPTIIILSFKAAFAIIFSIATIYAGYEGAQQLGHYATKGGWKLGMDDQTISTIEKARAKKNNNVEFTEKDI